MARFFPHLTTEEELRKVGNEKEALYREYLRPFITTHSGLHAFLKEVEKKKSP